MAEVEHGGAQGVAGAGLAQGGEPPRRVDVRQQVGERQHEVEQEESADGAVDQHDRAGAPAHRVPVPEYVPGQRMRRAAGICWRSPPTWCCTIPKPNFASRRGEVSRKRTNSSAAAGSLVVVGIVVVNQDRCPGDPLAGEGRRVYVALGVERGKAGVAQVDLGRKLTKRSWWATISCL